MRKPIIAIKLSSRDYAGVINLGNRVIASLTGNGNFTTPSPTLLALQAAVTNVETAFAVWSPVGSRGSHASLGDLREKSLTLYNLLKAEAQYVQNAATIAAGNDYPTMTAVLLTSGFELASTPSPKGVLNAVTGFRKVASDNLNPNQVKFHWKKPLDTTSKNVYVYKVMRGTTLNIANAQEIATTSRTVFIDTNETGVVQQYTYWIIPVNNQGEGAASVAATVSILG